MKELVRLANESGNFTGGWGGVVDQTSHDKICHKPKLKVVAEQCRWIGMIDDYGLLGIMRTTECAHFLKGLRPKRAASRTILVCFSN